MSEDGYTLVEMLAALAILGLALAGMAESVHALMLVQTSSARSISDRAATDRVRRGLVHLVAGQGPFRSKDVSGLSGDRTALGFDCGDGAKCGARLSASGPGARLDLWGPGGWRDAVRLHVPGGARFAYGDADGFSEGWPPATTRTRRLTAIAVVSVTGGEPIALVRLWRDQGLDCQFDPILEDCREPAQ